MLDPPLAWRKSEGAANRDADDGVEPDGGPCTDTVRQVEEDERRSDEAEGELGDEPGEDVVETLVGECFAAVGGQEERSEEAAGI